MPWRRSPSSPPCTSCSLHQPVHQHPGGPRLRGHHSWGDGHIQDSRGHALWRLGHRKVSPQLFCMNYAFAGFIEYRSDNVMAFYYSIVMVPNKRSLHQALVSGLEQGTCIVSNRCDHRSSGCQKMFRISFHVDEWLWCHTSVLYDLFAVLKHLFQGAYDKEM